MSKQSTLVNASDASDIRNLVEGAEKVIWVPDARFRQCGKFIIQLEDHTIGNLLKSQLLKNPDVNFAGYRMPHPLEHKLEIRLKTDSIDPVDCMREAIDELRDICQNMSRQLEVSLEEQNQLLGAI